MKLRVPLFCDRELGIPMKFQQWSQALPPVESYNSTFFLRVKGMSVLLLSQGEEFRIFLKLQQGSQTTCCVVRGNSGFHLSCSRGKKITAENNRENF